MAKAGTAFTEGVAMLERAVFVTSVQPGFSTSRRWPALVDMRRDQARSLALAGAMFCLDETVIYALEGDPPRLDLFLRLLGASPCEARPDDVWREETRYRRHRVLALSQPQLNADEDAGLRQALAGVDPDYEAVTNILSVAATRSALQLYQTPLRATSWLTT
jgi:hypothetical protein